MHKPLRTLVNAAVIGILATSAAHSGGFSLYTESSALMTGNFGAGAAAEGADASTGWYNPAGLVLIRDQQAVFGGVGVFPTSKLSGTSTFTASTVLGPLPTYTQTFYGIDGAENAFVPSFHYAKPIGESATVGLSVVSPFGLSTDWGVNSPVRYQATFTELLTTNISPEIGGKLSENFALGLGIDFQYARVKFNRMLGAPNIGLVINPANPAVYDTLSYNRGSSWGLGFHAGALGMFNDNHTRLGLNYQSKVKHTFSGYSQLSGPLANVGGNVFAPGSLAAGTTFRSSGLLSNEIELPDVITLSAYHDLNDTIALLGSVVYTGWDVFNTIQLNSVVAPSVAANGVISRAYVDSASPQNYTNAWRAAIGANYKVNEQWLLRVGGGFDNTPTNDLYRDVRLPDTDRWALSVGAHYQMKPALGFDVGYTHIFASDDSIVNRTDAITSASAYNVTASGSPSADLVGAQLVWTIDQPVVVATK